MVQCVHNMWNTHGEHQVERSKMIER